MRPRAFTGTVAVTVALLASGDTIVRAVRAAGVGLDPCGDQFADRSHGREAGAEEGEIQLAVGPVAVLNGGP